MKKRANPNLSNRLLIKLAIDFYGKRYFSKKCKLIHDGSLRKIETPFILVANHASFADVGGVVMMLGAKKAASYIASKTQFANFGNILNKVGVLAKKQFTVDTGLIRDVKYVLDHGRPVVLYPEAKLSVDGTPNEIKPGIAKLVKLLKVPLVTVRFDGSYLHHPRWSGERRFVPVRATVKVAVTADEIGNISVNEIYERIVNHLSYDDYRYQRESKIEIRSDKLVEGLEGLLYRCPECGCEFVMSAKGNELTCQHCGAKFTMDEFGQISGKFSSVPEWYAFERKAVHQEIENSAETLSFEAHGEVMNKNKFVPCGDAVFQVDGEGGIKVEFKEDGKELVFPKGLFYTLSFNNKYVFLPSNEVYRFSFDKVGLTTKLNLLVEEHAKIN